MEEKTKSRQQVLVVDDEPGVCSLLADALEAEGYASETCNHPEEALQLSRSKTFGLVFVDIRLPGMSGFDLASMLKAEAPEREVVFITSYESFDSVLRAIKIGAYDYLRKPFNLSELNLCLRRYQERRELKDRARSAERRYFDLVQNIPVMIWVLRRDLELAFVNDACEVLLGYTAAHAMASPGWFLKHVHPSDRSRLERLLVSAFDIPSAPFEVGCRLIHRKGRQVHVLIKSLPQGEVLESGARVQLEGIVVDITDRVLLEHTAVQREKLKTLGAISAEVAHEIRNPLVSIGGFARRLKRNRPELTEGEIILKECRRLEDILDRIQDYLKPVEVRPKPCKVNDIIRTAAEFLFNEFERGRTDCHLELDESISAAQADPEVLAEVLTSLGRNVIEAMDWGEVLTIRSAESDLNVQVIFRGRVPQTRFKNLEELLLPFEEARKNRGLPGSFKILRTMGGVLGCEREGNEIVFTVSLPKQ